MMNWITSEIFSDIQTTMNNFINIKLSLSCPTCREPPPASDSPAFSDCEARVSHSGRLRDPEPFPPGVQSVLTDIRP